MWSSFAELRTHSGFTEDDEARLLALGPRLAVAARTMPSNFLERARRIPALQSILEGSACDVDELGQNLGRWLEQFLSAPRDQTYLTARASVGHTHAQV